MTILSGRQITIIDIDFISVCVYGLPGVLYRIPRSVLHRHLQRERTFYHEGVINSFMVKTAKNLLKSVQPGKLISNVELGLLQRISN